MGFMVIQRLQVGFVMAWCFGFVGLRNLVMCCYCWLVVLLGVCSLTLVSWFRCVSFWLIGHFGLLLAWFVLIDCWCLGLLCCILGLWYCYLSYACNSIYLIYYFYFLFLFYYLLLVRLVIVYWFRSIVVYGLDVGCGLFTDCCLLIVVLDLCCLWVIDRVWVYLFELLIGMLIVVLVGLKFDLFSLWLGFV